MLAGVARLPPGEDRRSKRRTQLCAPRRLTASQATGAFDTPEQWRFEWAQSYTRDQWLDALQTTGGAIPENRLPDLLEGIGNAIDGVGGSFTMHYLTFVVTAARRS